MKTLSKRHQIVVNIPYTLLSFLIEHKVLTKFLDNAVDDKHSQLKILQTVDAITFAFIWRKTKEGTAFWENLAKLYYERVIKGI